MKQLFLFIFIISTCIGCEVLPYPNISGGSSGGDPDCQDLDGQDPLQVIPMSGYAEFDSDRVLGSYNNRRVRVQFDVNKWSGKKDVQVPCEDGPYASYDYMDANGRCFWEDQTSPSSGYVLVQTFWILDSHSYDCGSDVWNFTSSGTVLDVTIPISGLPSAEDHGRLCVNIIYDWNLIHSVGGYVGGNTRISGG